MPKKASAGPLSVAKMNRFGSLPKERKAKVWPHAFTNRNCAERPGCPNRCLPASQQCARTAPCRVVSVNKRFAGGSGVSVPSGGFSGTAACGSTRSITLPSTFTTLKGPWLSGLTGTMRVQWQSSGTTRSGQKVDPGVDGVVGPLVGNGCCGSPVASLRPMKGPRSGVQPLDAASEAARLKWWSSGNMTRKSAAADMRSMTARKEVMKYGSGFGPGRTPPSSRSTTELVKVPACTRLMLRAPILGPQSACPTAASPAAVSSAFAKQLATQGQHKESLLHGLHAAPSMLRQPWKCKAHGIKGNQE
mmetsp:Transcript_51331/g.119311  ORF Transcript_51331/g.119311 Transcript_51331/m.119311 type:complete len:304 (+) Transcript_51331:372-1283(+)